MGLVSAAKWLFQQAVYDPADAVAREDEERRGGIVFAIERRTDGDRLDASVAGHIADAAEVFGETAVMIADGGNAEATADVTFQRHATTVSSQATLNAAGGRGSIVDLPQLAASLPADDLPVLTPTEAVTAKPTLEQDLWRLATKHSTPGEYETCLLSHRVPAEKVAGVVHTMDEPKTYFTSTTPTPPGGTGGDPDNGGYGRGTPEDNVDEWWRREAKRRLDADPEERAKWDDQFDPVGQYAKHLRDKVIQGLERDVFRPTPGSRQPNGPRSAPDTGLSAFSSDQLFWALVAAVGISAAIAIIELLRKSDSNNMTPA